MRAEFRVTYFVHGKNHMYNYEMTQHMFVCRNETSSMENGIVRLRSLYDDDNTFVYPLYASRCPQNLLTAIRLVWRVRNMMHDWCIDLTRYIIVCLATWAYTSASFPLETRNKPDDICRQVMEAYPRCLDMDFMLHMIIASERANKISVRQRRTWTAKHVARQILQKSSSNICLVIRATLPCHTVRKLYRPMVEFITDHVHIISASVIEEKTDERYWKVIKDEKHGRRTIATVTSVIRTVNRGALPLTPPVTQAQQHVSLPRVFVRHLSPSVVARYSLSRAVPSLPQAPLFDSGKNQVNQQDELVVNIRKLLLYW